MGVKSYPTVSDAWCEDSLTPPEGSWRIDYPIDGNVERSSTSVVGARSVHSYRLQGISLMDLTFRLNDGREFNGLGQQAKLHFKLMVAPGSLLAWDMRIRVYDAAGKRAHLVITLQVGVFEDFTLNLGPEAGWIETPGFDWRFIKKISFSGYGWFEGLEGGLYVDEMYFSYYILELGRLTVLSAPSNKAFKIDGTFYTSPTYNLGLLPSTDYTVMMQPSGFKYWEDMNTNPSRTINLTEAETKTIIAYYEGGEPPPGKGKLNCVAYADSGQVEARVEIVDVDTYYTPFEVDLNLGDYTLTAYYKEQTRTITVSIVEGYTTPAAFYFEAPPSPRNLGFWLLGLGIAAASVIAILIFPEKLKRLVGW